LLNNKAELLEHVDELYGLPTPLTAIGKNDGLLFLQQDKNVWQLDIEQMSFTQATGSQSNMVWVGPATLPEEYAAPMRDEMMGPGVNWERFMLDLHSGQFFGFKGRLLTDFFAFGLILLAFSGLWVWSTKPGRWKK
jgi:uncharacterized iron-regulated membrane protein